MLIRSLRTSNELTVEVRFLIEVALSILFPMAHDQTILPRGHLKASSSGMQDSWRLVDMGAFGWSCASVYGSFVQRVQADDASQNLQKTMRENCLSL